MVTEQQTQIKQFGMTRTVRNDGVIAFQLVDLRRDTVDVFIDALRIADEVGVENDAHMRTLLDVSQLNMPTPYALKRIQEAVASTPTNLRESIAIVTPTTSLYTFARTLMNSISHDKRSAFRLFKSEAEALAWLDERHNSLG